MARGKKQLKKEEEKNPKKTKMAAVPFAGEKGHRRDKWDVCIGSNRSGW